MFRIIFNIYYQNFLHNYIISSKAINKSRLNDQSDTALPYIVNDTL